MAAEFTTWSDLARKMRDDFARGDWRTKSYNFDGMQREFITPTEFIGILTYVEQRAAKEADGCVTRTSAQGTSR